MTFTDKVNDWVLYFKDEYIEGDNNVFKIESIVFLLNPFSLS